MRAITVTAFGDPSVLHLTELPTPTPGPDQVLVRVAAAGVGPWDTKARKGLFGARELPYVPGVEVSGTVEAVGNGDEMLSIGQAVYGSPAGGYAEYALADVTKVAPAPSAIDLADAAALPIGAVTALEGIDDHLHLREGDRVLVAGAAGGVGTFVVQLAKVRGAHVTATAQPANHQFLRDLGADRVLDYRGDWVAEAAEVDAAYDCVGGPTWEGCVSALREGGRAVTIAAFGSPVTREGVELSNFSASVTAARLSEIAALVDTGRVKVTVSARFPLDEAARVHELVETGHTRGKILLVP
ncbi:MAG TPA: NADP-dependent oxidoreductase [Acidimicrobiales bacterium]|jgi:NADPH:quinone reductase-like Zn-dependent oxidoreductase|nr:NADP-dependent oxidoreductase [Acidimicrobiales bacterium]